jgi:hypothetical protein
MNRSGTPPVVAVIDSGISGACADRVVARRAFVSVDCVVETRAAEPDAVGHGSAVARLVVEADPATRLIDAQVFLDRAVTTPGAVAEAVRWAVAEGADVIVLSLGLRSDRESLRTACAEALAAGVVVVASAPARGQPVYPAAYPGVVRASGDARCRVGEVSWLRDGFAEYGTCCLLAESSLGRGSDRPSGGASFAAARLAGFLAAALADGSLERGGDPHACLRAAARYVGRERRLG